MRFSMSGAMPGPSSEMTISTVSVPPGVDLDRGPGEIDGILQNVANAVEDRGVTGADRLVRRCDR